MFKCSVTKYCLQVGDCKHGNNVELLGNVTLTNCMICVYVVGESQANKMKCDDSNSGLWTAITLNQLVAAP